MPAKPGPNAPLAIRSFDRIDDVPADDWDALAATVSHPFLDRRYLGTLERTLDDVAFRWVLIDDADGRPVAGAGFSVLEVDVGNLGSERLRGFLRVYRRLRPTALRYNVVLCGMPISNGRECLAIDPQADTSAVAVALDAAAMDVAREHRGRLVVFKEYDEGVLDSLAPLESSGFDRVDSLPLHVLPVEQPTFEEYVASRSKRTRRNIRDYFRSGEAAGLEVEHLRGADGAAERLTDEVHELYLRVFDKASVQFERLPRDFFVELANSLPEESRFTFVRHAGRVVGFVAGLRKGSLHTLLKVGYDTEFDPNAKLYFFTMYNAIQRAFEEPLAAISVGQGADEFKRRLGCTPQPRRFLLKAPGRLFGSLARWVTPRVFPRRYDPPADSRPE